MDTYEHRVVGFFGRLPAKPHDLTDRITPADKCIVLCHLGVPIIPTERWRLTIGGLVGHELSLSWDDLLKLPKTTLISFHQCAGSPLDPHNPTQRVCNVQWGGTRLNDVLDRCGVDPAARFVWATGADSGSFSGVDCGAYTKDIPIGRLNDDVLLAYEMNGEPLPEAQGFPVRLVVPGFYGTNSVKWLTRIELARDRPQGPFTTLWYNELNEEGNATVPVWDVAPQSVIVSPAPERETAKDESITIWGWAWGDEPIQRVEVSTDAGLSWRDAQLEQPVGRGWRRFAIDWSPTNGGSVRLMSRAVAVSGRVQPLEGRRNAVYPVPVHVV